MLKTIDALKEAQIIKNGQVVETIEVKNPCQMWKHLDEWFEKHGKDSEIKVIREDGSLFKDFTIVTLKNGKTQKVNSVKETNRWMMMKATGKPMPKKVRKPAVAAVVQETNEEEKVETLVAEAEAAVEEVKSEAV